MSQHNSRTPLSTANLKGADETLHISSVVPILPNREQFNGHQIVLNRKFPAKLSDPVLAAIKIRPTPVIAMGDDDDCEVEPEDDEDFYVNDYRDVPGIAEHDEVQPNPESQQRELRTDKSLSRGEI